MAVSPFALMRQQGLEQTPMENQAPLREMAASPSTQGATVPPPGAGQEQALMQAIQMEMGNPNTLERKREMLIKSGEVAKTHKQIQNNFQKLRELLAELKEGAV